MSFFNKDVDISEIPYPVPSYLSCKPVFSENPIRELIKEVAELDFSVKGKPKTVYAIEEAAELMDELSQFIIRLTKGERRLIPHKEIVDEACDLLTTVFIFLKAHDVSEEYVKYQIRYKCERTIERFKNGEEK